MVARSKKLKKQSGGSYLAPWQHRDFVFYLDENLCNSRAIQEKLERLGIRYERHLSHFSRGTADDVWLPQVGENKWILLTADKQIRYNLLEKRALQRFSVAEFVFASGNLSGADMGSAVELAIGKIVRVWRKTAPPFVAMITKTGEVHLRWPKSEQTKRD